MLFCLISFLLAIRLFKVGNRKLKDFHCQIMKAKHCGRVLVVNTNEHRLRSSLVRKEQLKVIKSALQQ